MRQSHRSIAGAATGEAAQPAPEVDRRVPAQRALRQGGSRLRNVFQVVPDPMMLLGVGRANLGRFLQVNPAMSQLTGYSEQRLMSMQISELAAPDDPEAYSELLVASQQGAVPDGPVERHWIRADGHDLWVQIDVSPGRAIGDRGYVVARVTAITKQTQPNENEDRDEAGPESSVGRTSSATSAILQTLARAGSHPVLQSFPHGAIIVFDQELRYLSAAGLGLADVGLSRQVLEGQTIFDVFPGEVTSVIEPLYRAALNGSESVLDVPYEGRIFLQRLAPLRDGDGQIVAGMGFTQDVTENRRVQVKLQESEDRFRVLIEHAPIGLAIISLDQRYLEVNPAFCQITGYRAEQLLQSYVTDATDPIYSEAGLAGRQRLLQGEVSSYTTDARIHAFDGTTRWVSLSESILRNPDGSPSEFIVQVKDISERKRVEAALHEETTRLRNAEAVGRSGSWELDVATGTLEWSEGLFAIYGIDSSTFDGDFAAALDLVHSDDLESTGAAVDRCIEIGTPYRIRYRMTRPADGAVHWYEARGEQLQAEGEPVRIGGSVVDITDLIEAESEIKTAYTFQQAVMDASPDLIFAYELATRSVVWSNRSLATSLGFPDADSDFAGISPGGGSSALGAPELGAALLSALDTVGDNTAQLNLRLEDSSDEHHWFSLRTTPLTRGDRGEVTSLLGIMRDVTEAMVAEKHLEHTALHDSLTGLPNRALLIDRIDGALIRSGRDHREISVLFCDLDGFKHVNDTAGHAAGDAVLVETARRLQGVLRDGDTVARVGGDEFIILVEPWNRTPHDDTEAEDPDLVAAQDRALAPRIAARIAAALREPVVVNGIDHIVTASIGITYGSMSHAGDLRTASADDMVQDADAAMYKAKSRGKDRYEVFEQSMRASLQERSRVERLLRVVLNDPTLPAGRTAPAGQRATGMGRAQLTAAYQPIFDSMTHRLIGFEALARLVDADGVNVPPDVFIGIAEEIGVIHQLGVLILDLACGQLTTWRGAHPGTRDLTMAVNVSAIQAAGSDLGDDVHRALAGHSLRAQDLVLELTETALLQAAHSTIVNLRVLHDEGVGIAIDDFGVGYASLRYLATLPVSALKIDRSFTAGLPDDIVSRKIVTAVAGLAADLDLTCVVEGVETDEQRRALPKDVQLQGYLTGRPQPPHAIDIAHLVAHGAPPAG